MDFLDLLTMLLYKNKNEFYFFIKRVKTCEK